jgi:peptidoglycan/xylan/chitin deacetylase (PgdA/CDA1 family)
MDPSNLVGCIVALVLGITCAATPGPVSGAGPEVAPAPISTPASVTPAATPAPTPTPTPPAVSPAAAARARIPPPPLRPGAPVIEREIALGPTDRPRLAITFDAGVSRPQYTGPILDTLRAKGVRSTMFLTGQWAEENGAMVLQMAADGHDFANHSYSHPDFLELSNAQIADQLRRTDAIVSGLTGQSTRPFFRPPFGSRDRRVLDVIEAEGYYDIYWTLDSGDWVDGALPGQVFNKTVRGAVPGAIIIMHITTEATAGSIGPIIDALRASGLELVTLSELLAP